MPPPEAPRPTIQFGGAVLAWLGHPVTVLAVAVLALNDHALKQAAPGVVTGKLSDVAGLVVAPPLLAVVLWLLGLPLARLAGERTAERVAITTVCLTGLSFALVKTTAPGAQIASHAWAAVAGPSRVLADPTDLVALPVLWAAWWSWQRVRHQPLGTRAVRLVRLAIVLPAAVLVVAATSAYSPPDAIGVGEWEGMLVVVGRDITPLATGDGGATWRAVTEAQLPRIPTNGSLSQTTDCVAGAPTFCYRVVPGSLRVEQTVDGGMTWATAWEVSAGRQRFLRRSYEPAGGEPGGVALSSAAVVVQARPGGHVVIVANRRDGLLLRDVTGTWRRLGFPSYSAEDGSDVPADPVPPLVRLGANIGAEYVLGAIAGWLVLVIGAGLARRGARHPKLAASLHGVTALGFVLFLVAFVVQWPLSWIAGAVGAALVVLGMPAAAAVLAATTAAPPVSWWYWLTLFGLAAVTWVLVTLPFVGWTVARPDAYETAASMAAGAGLLGVGASVALGSWGRQRRATSPDPSNAAPPPRTP